MVITQLKPISLVFTIPQDEIIRVQTELNKRGQLEVEAYNRDFSTRLATGTLTAIDNQVDATTGTLRLKATFANDDNLLFPNEFVNVRLQVETLENAVTVPSWPFSVVLKTVLFTSSRRPTRKRPLKCAPLSLVRAKGFQQLSSPGWNRVRSSSRKESTSFNRAAKSLYRNLNEHLPDLYCPTGSYRSVHGGDRYIRADCLSQSAHFCVTTSRLSNDSSIDVLSGGWPGSHDFFSDRTTGATVRSNSGSDSDDLQQLGRLLGHYLEVCTRARHRHRRSASSSAINVAGSFLPRDLPNPPVYTKTNPAMRRSLRWHCLRTRCRCHAFRTWPTRGWLSAFHKFRALVKSRLAVDRNRRFACKSIPMHCPRSADTRRCPPGIGCSQRESGQG